MIESSESVGHGHRVRRGEEKGKGNAHDLICFLLLEVVAGGEAPGAQQIAEVLVRYLDAFGFLNRDTLG